MKKELPIIIADRISDLTLARYFASQVSDFLIVDLDRRDLAQNREFIAQLHLWVEGPDIIFTGSDSSVTGQLQSDWNEPQMFFIKDDFYDEDGKIKREIIHMLMEKKVGNAIRNAPVFYSDGTRHDAHTQDCSVMVIRPVPESRTGIYDFNALEDFFDALTTAG